MEVSSGSGFREFHEEMFAGELCASCRTGEISHRPKPDIKTKCVVLILCKEVFETFQDEGWRYLRITWRRVGKEERTEPKHNC